MPRLLGRYQLEHRLAEGGMAEVWLATAHGEAGFTRRVAIKQLFAPADDGGAFARMFLDEARITSRLHHASIVAIVDFGIEAGRPFQVLELVDGFDSARLERWGRAAGAPLPVGLALHVCAVVGHALHFAHVATDEAGAPLNIVHRDVSPQNVLISRSGDVKLSDFGIAFAEGRAEKTVGAVSRGKPAYMAPEQAVRGAMDGRTDVFALGCVLHTLVTGESALRDENALVDLLAGQELALHPQLPEAVRAIVARATRRNRAERFESAEAMALACSQRVPSFLAEEPRLALRAWVKAVAPAVGAAAEAEASRARAAAVGEGAARYTDGVSPRGGATPSADGATPGGGAAPTADGATPRGGAAQNVDGGTLSGGVTQNADGAAPSGGAAQKADGATTRSGAAVHGDGSTTRGAALTADGATPRGGAAENADGGTPGGGGAPTADGATPRGGAAQNVDGATTRGGAAEHGDGSTTRGAAPTVDGATPNGGRAQSTEGTLGAAIHTRTKVSRFAAGAFLVTGLLLLGGVWLRKEPRANATGDAAGLSASSPSREPDDLAPKLAANGPAQTNEPAVRVAESPAQHLAAEPRADTSPAGPRDRPVPAPRSSSAQKGGAARTPGEAPPTGVLAGGGELLLGGEVFIDGQVRGFAPGRFELPVGTHRVEVLARDGTRHGPRDLKVTRQHTQSSALQWQE